ncbi:MAG: diguanylate cyclase [Patulibacter minatonensis]
MGKVSHLIAATREVLDTRDLSTGLLKKAAFERAVDAWVGGGDARRPATSLLMIQVGEKGAGLAERPDRQLLLHLAKTVTGLLRATDIVGHVDEDTLGVLLPSTPLDSGTRAAERILDRFRASNYAQSRNLAATIGVASANTDEPWLASLQALREARLAGGDQISVASERPEPVAAAAETAEPAAGAADSAA